MIRAGDLWIKIFNDDEGSHSLQRRVNQFFNDAPDNMIHSVDVSQNSHRQTVTVVFSKKKTRRSG